MKRELITNKLKVPNTNLEVLNKNFSHCFDKTGKFDFEKFKKELETKREIDFSNESYGMNWLGKSYARLLAVDEAKTLLKENKDWNQRPENKNSENLLIKGDNLEVIKHLSNSYREKIKMIYIDPPYNTGSDGFVYQDDRKFSVEELSELAGIEQDKAKRILDFTKSKSNSHSAWLTFMYPRLYIAKQLLRDDGVIFISIDDNEVAQLRLLMDEIFGEDNFVEIFSWTKTSTPPALSNKSRKTNEYILCYEKNKNSYRYFGENLDGGDQPLGNEGNNVGILEIPKEKIKFLTKDGKYDVGLYHRIKLLDTINIKNGEPDKNIRVEGHFKWQQSFLDNEVKKGTTFVVKSGKFSIRFLRIYDESHKTPTNYIKDKIINPLLDKENCNVDTNETSSKQLEELFGVRMFEFPKPVSLIKYLINFIPESDIILDFFAGSGTTGDAVMQLNAEDGGNRKFILVQLPEPIDPKKNKTAYDFVKGLLSTSPAIAGTPQEENNYFLSVDERVTNSPLEGWQTKSDGVDKTALTDYWQSKSLFPFWHLPKNKELLKRAKDLRKQGILSEVLFWKAFRNKDKLKNYDIDRQVIIGNFIVDFFISELGLVIELDGSSHNDKQEYDMERDSFLNGLNLRVVRYTDNEIKTNLDSVSINLLQIIEDREKELLASEEYLARQVEKSNPPRPASQATPQERNEIQEQFSIDSNEVINKEESVPTIFDITKERLIRAGKKSYESLVVSSKLKNQQLETNNSKLETNLDFSFRIFETTPIWEDYNLDMDEFDSQLKLFNQDKLTEEDLQILLITWKTYDGFSLTQDLEKLELDGYPAYYLNKKLYLVNKGFKTKNLKVLIEKIDADQNFEPTTIISFGYNFESKVLREISENIKNYMNKKNIDIDFIVRY